MKEFAVLESRKRRRIDPEEKKNLVIKAARRLFVQKGFHNVPITSIVESSGVSTGAIYSYFPTKEDLAKYIHEQTIGGFLELFMARLEGRQTTYDKLRAFAELVFELTESDPDLMEYFIFMRHDEFIRGCAPVCFSEPFKIIRAIVTEGIARGDLRPGDFFLTAVSFTGAILRPCELRLCCVLETPLPEVAEELITSAWAAIRA